MCFTKKSRAWHPQFDSLHRKAIAVRSVSNQIEGERRERFYIDDDRLRFLCLSLIDNPIQPLLFPSSSPTSDAFGEVASSIIAGRPPETTPAGEREVPPDIGVNTGCFLFLAPAGLATMASSLSTYSRTATLVVPDESSNTLWRTIRVE